MARYFATTCPKSAAFLLIFKGRRETKPDRAAGKVNPGAELELELTLTLGQVSEAMVRGLAPPLG